jgi:hypothetical protein
MFLVAFPRMYFNNKEYLDKHSERCQGILETRKILFVAIKFFLLVAPLCAFLNNIVEIRIDANKFVCDVRRPVAKKVADIGI